MSAPVATRAHGAGARMPAFAAEAGALALVLAAVAYVATRNLHTYPNYDEGNYLGSLDALRHGQALGKDVFLDQPPGWYLLLVAVSYPFGNSIVGVRTGLAVVALTAVVAAYFGGRLVGGPVAGVVSAAVMAVARPFASLVATVESEPASAALAVVAVVLAAYAYRNRFRPWLAFASGVALAASAAVKLPGLTAALPIAGLAVMCGSGPLARRLLMPAAGAAAVCTALVVAYRNALPQIWHGVFVTHARILGSSSTTSNLYQVERYVDPRTPWGCLFICGGIASIILVVQGRERRLLIALWLWVFPSYAFVLAMHPLSSRHFVFLGVSIALPAGVALGLLVAQLGIRRPAGIALALLVALFVAAALVRQKNEIARADTTEPPEIAWAVRALHTHTQPGQLVASDLPIVPYLAHRRMPGQLIDTSIARIADEDLPPAGVLKLIDQTRPDAVIIGRMFQTKPAIVSGIRARYARRLHYQLHPGYVDIYLDRRS
jgi:4-amino-4-deoxy-L-arabinose transferase-like glycosyltransferase